MGCKGSCIIAKQLVNEFCDDVLSLKEFNWDEILKDYANKRLALFALGMLYDTAERAMERMKDDRRSEDSPDSCGAACRCED